METYYKNKYKPRAVKNLSVEELNRLSNELIKIKYRYGSEPMEIASRLISTTTRTFHMTSLVMFWSHAQMILDILSDEEKEFIDNTVVDIRITQTDMRGLFNNTTSCQECGKCCCGFPPELLDYIIYSHTGAFKNMMFPLGKKGCIFITLKGCLIDNHLRPRVCASHVCGKLGEELAELKLLDKHRALRKELFELYNSLGSKINRYIKIATGGRRYW
jgi:hypothetical protein